MKSDWAYAQDYSTAWTLIIHGFYWMNWRRMRLIIQLHLSSVNISFHLYDFSQQNKIHVTPIFLGARVNWFQIRCSLSFRSSTPAGGSMASSMIPANPATAEVALFLSDRFFIEYLHRSSDTESILVRYFSSYTTVWSLVPWSMLCPRFVLYVPNLPPKRGLFL